MTQTRKTILMIGAIITVACFITSVVFLALGFDKKNNYHQYDSYVLEDVNAYVVGDAYNYIINSGYFAGYAAVGGCFFISFIISLGATITANFYLKSKEDPDEQDGKILNKIFYKPPKKIERDSAINNRGQK